MKIPWKIENSFTIWSSDLTLGFLAPLKLKTESWRDICMSTLIGKRWNQPQCPSADAWIFFLMWSIYIMEYYSAFKKEILSYTTTWMNVRALYWVKSIWIKKTYSIWFHLYEVSEVVRFIKTGSKTVVTRS